jgi:DNA-binding winged helix-turn-helix (wHTH) protein
LIPQVRICPHPSPRPLSYTEVPMLQIVQAGFPDSRHDRASTMPPARQAARPGLRFGRCEVRAASREVLVNGRRREIQPRPFDLLVYLIEHRERVLSMDELLDAIWGRQIVQPSSLTVAINRIRSVLEDDGGEIIRTHHRVGYRFVAELDDESAAIALPRHTAES